MSNDVFTDPLDNPLVVRGPLSQGPLPAYLDTFEGKRPERVYTCGLCTSKVPEVFYGEASLYIGICSTCDTKLNSVE